MTTCASETVSTYWADWSLPTVGNSMPPRDPNDDDDEEEEDGDVGADEDEPAVIREPDE
jgi:hypothetical protein